MHKRLCTPAVLFALTGTALLAGAAGGAPAVEPTAGEAAILPLEQVRPGMKGYGLSVFAGTEPERFEVEVLGVWKNLRPGASYILGRLRGRGLEVSGVIAGMSGSPVYLDGRLAGAVAFAWPFALEPVAGITPIEAMRALAGPSLGPSPAGGGWLPSLGDLAAADLPEDLLARRLAALAPRPAVEETGGLLWSGVGLGPESRRLLAAGLGRVTPAGRAEGAGGELAPGQAVAGLLVDGDLRLAATGTVTDRRGTELLAFGHPFLGLGPVRVPMATADVITVVPSRFSSFKIVNVGPVVGAFDLDRIAGVRGRLGLEAPMTPVRVAVRGERGVDFALWVARLPSVTPALVAISALASVEAATQAAGDQGLDLDARFDLGAEGELRIRQSFDGPTAVPQAAVYLMAFTAYLMNNPLERVEIEAIEMELGQHELPRTARLVEAHAGQTIVRPGDRVPLNLDLVAYRGERFRRSLEVDIPTGLADGRYSLLVGDGVSVDVARLQIERIEPVRFSQALDFLRSLHSRRQLVVMGVIDGAGLSVAGESLPQLPGSLRSIWGAAGSTSAQPLRLAVAQQKVIEMDVPVAGIARVDLEVKRRGAMTAAQGEGEEGETPAAEAPPEDASDGAPAEAPATAERRDRG